MERQSTRPSLTSQSVPVIASNKQCLPTFVIFRFPRRFKLCSLQLASVKALYKYFIPSSPNSLSLMSELVNAQFSLVKASGKSFNTLSPNLLWLTFELVNVQLLLVRIVNKSIIPSSHSPLQLTFKLVTDLLLRLISASHKSIILFFQRKSLWRLNWLIASRHLLNMENKGYSGALGTFLMGGNGNFTGYLDASNSVAVNSIESSWLYWCTFL